MMMIILIMKMVLQPKKIKFYSLFIGWISNGMINREDILLPFCHNLIFNYVETPVNSRIQTIIDTETVKIMGFDNEQSQSLYRNIYSAGAISYIYSLLLRYIVGIFRCRRWG